MHVLCPLVLIKKCCHWLITCIKILVTTMCYYMYTFFWLTSTLNYDLKILFKILITLINTNDIINLGQETMINSLHFTHHHFVFLTY